MSNQKSKPKAGMGDAAHTIAKAGLSLIPIIGGPAAEIFNAIITPPLAKRRDEWIKSIVDGLKELEEKMEDYRIENLSQNEMFITTVMQASQAAVRNHQKEKLEALRNAVLNSSLSNQPDEDLQIIYLDLIDSLTPWGLRILKLFENPKEWGQKHNIQYPNWRMGGGADDVLEHAMPELKNRRDFYDPIIKDLFNKGLLGTDSLHGMTSENGMLASKISERGKQFLKFIESPMENVEK